MKKFVLLSTLILVMGVFLSSFENTTYAIEKEKTKEKWYEVLGFTKEEIKDLKSNPSKESKLNSNLKLSKKEVLHFANLGFNKDEIMNLEEVEYDRWIDFEGELISLEEVYYEIDNEGTEVITKEEALERVKKHKEEKNKVSIAAAGDEVGRGEGEVSWMRQVVTVTEGYSTDEYAFKNSFTWLVEPVWTLQDVVGISHSTDFVPIQESEYMKYTYDKYTKTIPPFEAGTESVFDYSADTKNAFGRAFKFDIKGEITGNGGPDYVVENNRGYMMYRGIKDDPTSSIGGAYGHYAHTEVAILGLAVSLTTGAISLTGSTSVSYCEDAYAQFYW